MSANQNNPEITLNVALTSNVRKQRVGEGETDRQTEKEKKGERQSKMESGIKGE